MDFAVKLFVIAFGWGFVLLCFGLMTRFIVNCWVQIKTAPTASQFFTVILRLLAGLILFPFTIIFQLCSVVMD